MSFGKLVLVSDLKGVNFPVKKTNNGIILENLNKEYLLEQIINIKKMSKFYSKKTIIDKYNKNFNAIDFKKNFLELLNFK